jgi:hypothetical protein
VLSYRPIKQPYAGGIDSLESIPGLLKSIKILPLHDAETKDRTCCTRYLHRRDRVYGTLNKCCVLPPNYPNERPFLYFRPIFNIEHCNGLFSVFKYMVLCLAPSRLITFLTLHTQ